MELGLALFAGLCALGLLGLVLSRPAEFKSAAAQDDPLSLLDFSDLPPLAEFTARDGTALSYYHYRGGAHVRAVLVHGLAGPGQSMHFLARALNAAGITVEVLNIRGHWGSGRSGDIDYNGQLDDDLADFIATLEPKRTGERRVLVGFSSGGAFAIRIAGGKYAALFDEYVVIAPALAPAFQPAAHRAYARLARRRIALLNVLGSIGMHGLDHLRVVAFAESARGRYARFYSHRLWANFGSNDRFAADLKAARAKITVLVGTNDQMLVTDRLSALIKEARADIPVRIISGLGHIDLLRKPAAFEAVISLIR